MHILSKASTDIAIAIYGDMSTVEKKIVINGVTNFGGIRAAGLTEVDDSMRPILEKNPILKRMMAAGFITMQDKKSATAAAADLNQKDKSAQLTIDDMKREQEAAAAKGMELNKRPKA